MMEGVVYEGAPVGRKADEVAVQSPGGGRLSCELRDKGTYWGGWVFMPGVQY